MQSIRIIKITCTIWTEWIVKLRRKGYFPGKLSGTSCSEHLLLAVLGIIIFGDKSSKYNVDVSRITIEEVKQDVFQDYITVQGTVEPITTIYLDAVEGGRVEEILIEEGNMVKKGDVIIRLNNDNLLLEITNNEAQVVRAINELRTASCRWTRQSSTISNRSLISRQGYPEKKDVRKQ